MAVERLTERMVKQAKTTGVLLDGNGLSISIPMRRRAAGELIERLRLDKTDQYAGALRCRSSNQPSKRGPGDASRLT
ncbi:MAG: hypothetical protein AB7F85_04550 [Hyphomonadaceae bacterium]